ncbi:MAG: pre-peptidase C-terminal domain-containing protein [Phycisphaerales bacterium]
MDRTKRGVVSLAAALAMLAGTAGALANDNAPATDVAALDMGADLAQPGGVRVERGSLRRGDRELNTGEYYDEYEIRVEAGQRLIVNLESDDFDTYVIVFSPDDEQFENDDAEGGDSTNSSIEVDADATGTYRVLVTSYEAGETGRYTLEMELGEGAGEQVVLLEESGTLRRGDRQLESGEYSDSYVFEGEEGQVVTIRLESDAFDTYLILKHPDGEQTENDDHNGSTSISQVRVTLPEDGEYEILVTSYEAGETGDYDLIVTAEADGGGPATLNERGELRRGDEQLRTEEYVDVYEFRAQAGQRIRASVTSDDFDTYLIIVDPNEDQTENDDAEGASTTDSAIDMVAEVSGTYEVWVTSYEPGETGRYTVRVDVSGRADRDEPAVDEPARPARRPEARPPADAEVGQVLNERGSLRRGDEQLRSGEYMDRFTFEGVAGQRAVVRLESEDFDTYLILKDPDGEQEENDDFEGETSVSQVETTLEKSGTYEVLVTSYEEGETGAYRVTVELTGGASGGSDRPGRGGARPGRNSTDRPAPPADAQQGVTVEQGSLRRGDNELEGSGEYFDEYTFRAEAGQHVVVRMNSDDFDTYLIVIPPEGEQLDNDDFNGSTQVSFVEATATTAGQWRVLCTSYEAGETGDYSVSMAVRNSHRFYDDADTTRIGQSARGSLTQSDRVRDTGEFADIYRFQGQPGTFYTVDVTTNDRGLDTFLILDRERGANLLNDDFESSLQHSRVQFLATQEGPIDLIVSSYEAGMTGDYEITVESTRNVPEWHHEPSVVAGRVFGVFAGITEYGNRSSDLEYCATDAERAYEAAVNSLGMDPSNGVLLMNDDATAGAFESAIHSLAPRMDYDDVLIVFYSGHGGQVERSAFQATDPDMRDETLVMIDQDILDDDLDQMLASVTKGTTLLVIDSCHSGGLAKDVISRPGRMGVFASAEDCLSLVATEREAGGYLSDFFIEAIGEGRTDADTDGDHRLTAIELTQFLAERYRTEVSSDAKPPATPHQWNPTVSPGDFLGYQLLQIDRGGIAPHEVLFGW